MSNFSLWMTLTFAFALVANLLTKLWLANRQVRHVVAHREQVPTDFAQSISLDAHQKAAAYTIAKLRLGLIDLALDAALLLIWTLLGGLNLLNQWTLDWLGQGMSQQVALVVSFLLIGGLIGLPLSLYQTFGLEQRFGFNNSTFQLWLSDLLKGLVVGALLGLPILWLVLWLMQAGGDLWWLWTWASLVVYQLFVMWIAPNFIMPLFNKFTPLEDEALKERATQLMNECGFQSKGFFVMDGSRRSSHSNAFFTGFGSAKRVVFFDTLLKQLNGDEMQAVLAHELGHFKHRHILKMMVTSFASSLAGLALLGWLSQQVWFYTGLGISPNLNGSNDALALLLFMLVLPLFTFFVTPLSSRRSRRFEFEADAYAMQHAQASALRQSLIKMYQDNASTLTPDPWYVAFYYSHPPASQRLARMQA
jgi:STE24 endopeptidase